MSNQLVLFNIDVPNQEKKGCDHSNRQLSWLLQSNGHFHIKESCAECGSHLKWAPQTPENLQKLGPKPNPEGF